ncbi:MAG: biopolymer transporter ExbD [Acidobacteriia bacterium]|nr:biopolymer transporter ExbD [Terriglobia bacterium]
MAKHISTGKVTSDINVTPMADIMLVLLIIFMITTPLLQSGITVNLPKAKNPLEAPDAESKDATVVALDRQGRIFLGKIQTTETALMEALQKKFSGGEINKVMYLKADTSVLYGRVVEVVNKCRETGVERIGLMTEKEK